MENKSLQKVEKTTLMKPVQPAELIEYHKAITDLIKNALQESKDYGKIPGTTKETLYKAGAERLCKSFGASTSFCLVDKEIDHHRFNKYKIFDKFKKVWIDKNSLGLYRYIYKCKITAKDGSLLGEGDGACSTLEKKYVHAPHDNENTCIKMAQKRALVAATLNAFGLSDRFTQDMEDFATPTPDSTSQPSLTYDPHNANDKRKLFNILNAKGIDPNSMGDVANSLIGKSWTEIDNWQP